MLESERKTVVPALQVRDFPDGLYERLKTCAALEHRSIAQQTVALVEESLNMRAGYYWDGKMLHRIGRQPTVIDFDTASARAARIEKRKAIFAEIENIEWRGPKPTAEEIVATIREGHEERDERILQAAGFYGEPRAQEAEEAAAL